MLQWLTGNASKAEELLDPSGIGVLSASCCSAGAFTLDEALIKNVKQALADEGISRPIHFETVTHAQAALPSLMGKLDEAKMATVHQLMGVFATKGLAGFPVLLVGGKLAFSGVVPSVDDIRAKLRQQPAAAAPGAPA